MTHKDCVPLEDPNLEATHPTEKILDEVFTERSYQESRWGNEFDNLNTVSDWISFITCYASMCGTGSPPPDGRDFRSCMVKVAALAVAAVETYDRRGGDMAPRHWDVRYATEVVEEQGLVMEKSTRIDNQS